MNSTLKIKTAIFVFLIVNLSLIFFSIFPLWKGIKKSSENLLSLKEKLIFLEEDLKNLPELKKKEEKIKKTEEKMESFFVNKETPIEFIRFLENLSNDYQLSLELSPLPSKKASNDPWFSLNFQISLIGPFQNVARFIDKLEAGPFLVKVDGINIAIKDLSSKELEKSNLEEVKASLFLRVYGK